MKQHIQHTQLRKILSHPQVSLRMCYHVFTAHKAYLLVEHLIKVLPSAVIAFYYALVKAVVLLLQSTIESKTYVCIPFRITLGIDAHINSVGCELSLLPTIKPHNIFVCVENGSVMDFIHKITYHHYHSPFW